MIQKVAVQNFKRFKDRTEFEFKSDGVTFLAGGNNSGKSTLLQALAVWDFGRSVIEVNRGHAALLSGAKSVGVGISAEEFSPMALPNLKHLWSQLRPGGEGSDGYSLRIRCDWATNADPPIPRHLEIGFALANDRLFVKRVVSDVTAGDVIPRVAYLPPFAGMGPREERMSVPARKRLVGRGLAGAVLRNLLYDLWQQNLKERENAKSPRGRIPRAALAALRKSDGWEQLLMVLEEVFKTGISVARFDELYQTTIDVFAWNGRLINKQFRRIPRSPTMDLMVEGSGFLQWLSVYALAVDKELHVLLLDEPDAHLHPALQGHLIQKLRQLARENGKQVLLATHSTTILSETSVDRIFRMEDRGYLSDEGGRVKLFVGLGSEYAPRLDQLKRHKRLFLHDGPSDLDILQSWARTLGLEWPTNLVCWKYTKERPAREILFDELRAEIPELKGISLQDRDDYPFTMTQADLTFDNLPLFKRRLGLRRWRRRNIENYLLQPSAIARAAGRSEDDVRQLLLVRHGLNVLDNFTVSQCVDVLASVDGKAIIATDAHSVAAEFGVNYQQIAAAMQPQEIPDDGKELLRQLVEVCQP
jgi:predicted ATPase